MMQQSYARLLLEHWGVGVSDIPTSDKEEPDFLATFGDCRVLIEEKTKLDDPARVAARASTLSKGEIHGASFPLVRDNRLSGIVAKAASQLQSSSAQRHDFRLIWFTATGTEAVAKFHQFIATIYGTTKILEMGSATYRTCYFFRNSDFHRHASVIDGAVAAHVAGSSMTAKLCVNPLSPRAAALLESPVALSFGSAVEDPMAKETAGLSFVLDGDADRNNEAESLASLQGKYGTKLLMRFDLGHLSAAVSVGVSKAR